MRSHLLESNKRNAIAPVRKIKRKRDRITKRNSRKCDRTTKKHSKKAISFSKKSYGKGDRTYWKVIRENAIALTTI